MSQTTFAPCTRCGASDPKQTLLTPYVAYFMCRSCGAVWNLERSPDQQGIAEAPRGPQRRVSDHHVEQR